MGWYTFPQLRDRVDEQIEEETKLRVRCRQIGTKWIEIEGRRYQVRVFESPMQAKHEERRGLTTTLRPSPDGH